VDNPATHLELTMIHEAMILEYSGPYLGLIEWGASIKQLLLMTLLINSFLPFGLHSEWSLGGLLISLVYLLLKLLVLAASSFWGNHECQDAVLPRSRFARHGIHPGGARPGVHVPVLRSR
jgi:formate hydrogenlyase subunit 4